MVAGVWLLVKFRVLLHHRIHVIPSNSGVIVATGGIGLVTLFISSIIATRELDVKKIIALSTLRQVGFMFLISGLNLLSMSYFHLLSHAFYKSCIFIFIGITLLTRFHQQDKRYLVNEIGGLVTIVGLRLTLARLCGLAFTSQVVHNLKKYSQNSNSVQVFYLYLPVINAFSMAIVVTILNLNIKRMNDTIDTNTAILYCLYYTRSSIFNTI